MANMIACLKELTGGRGSKLFLFADEKSLFKCPDIYKYQFTTGTGEKLTLLD